MVSVKEIVNLRQAMIEIYGIHHRSGTTVFPCTGDPDEAEMYKALCCDKDVRKYLWKRTPYMDTYRITQQGLVHSEKQLTQEECPYYFGGLWHSNMYNKIYIPNRRAPVGFVSARINPYSTDLVTEVGCVVTDPNFWGRGIATIATAVFLQQLYNCGVNRVTITDINPGNEASIRLANRLLGSQDSTHTSLTSTHTSLTRTLTRSYAFSLASYGPTTFYPTGIQVREEDFYFASEPRLLAVA